MNYLRRQKNFVGSAEYAIQLMQLNVQNIYQHRVIHLVGNKPRRDQTLLRSSLQVFWYNL